MAISLDIDLCQDTSERRVVDLTKVGISCMPVLGHTHYRRKWEDIEEHVHKGHLEITYCKSGQLAFESQGRIYPFLPGHVFVSRPDQPHRMKENPKRTQTLYLLFKLPKRGQSILDLPYRQVRCLVDRLMSLPQRVFRADTRVEADFQRLFDIYDSPEGGNFRTLQLKATLLDLLLAVIDSASKKSGVPTRGNLNEVVEAMRRQPSRAWPIEELVSSTGLSPSALRMRFKSLTGLPPHGFLIDCRIRRAKEMLDKGVQSIAELAVSLGFVSARHFSSSFKLATGCSPREWMKNSQKRV
jgi:AraC-like DNA-binding protein